MKRIPRLISKVGWGIGIGAQSIIASVRASMGARMNNRGDEVEGRTGSLINSLTPSAIGCRRP